MGCDYWPLAVANGTISTGVADLTHCECTGDSLDQFFRRAVNIDRLHTGPRPIARSGAPGLVPRHAWPGSRAGRAVWAMVRCGTERVGRCSRLSGCIVVAVAAGFSGALAGCNIHAALVFCRRWAPGHGCVLDYHVRCRPRPRHRGANPATHDALRRRSALQQRVGQR